MTDARHLSDVRVSDWTPSGSDPAGVRREARRRRRVRTLGIVAGGAASVGVFAIVPMVVLGDSASRDREPLPALASEHTDLGVDAGYRPVGAMGLVLEVPKSWGTDLVNCAGWPVADTVAFGGVQSCGAPRPRVSSLIIAMRDDQTLAEVVQKVAATSSEAVGGVDDVSISGPQLVDGLWTVVVLDSSGRAAVLQATGERVARHFAEVLRPIPDGWAMIPQLVAENVAKAVSDLHDLGLTAQVEDEPMPPAAEILPGTVLDGVDPGEVLSLDPPPAALVPTGSVVKVSRALARD